MNRKEAEKILKENFGIEKFYDEQWESIEKLLRGERVLMIQRTGFGKSLVFQFTAFVSNGTAVIFSPLIALMRDQVNKLKSIGIRAAFVNSTLSLEEKQDILEKAKIGYYKMLYVAPERLEDSAWNDTVHQMRLSMIVVDEAHCVSVWGHDFRPSYRRIVNIAKQLDSSLPILACTATATPRVQEDIKEQFDNSNLTVIRGDLTRKNFSLNVIITENQEAKMLDLLEQIKSIEGTGIVYCGTQAETEIFSRWLEFNNINSVFYNSSLDNNTRMHIEDGLMKNRYKCVVSTNALGMGLDKPDIRFVVHTQVPTSLLHYYQEIGRAGRDNEPTKIILYYNPSDDLLPLSFIKSARPDNVQYEKVMNCLKLNTFGLKTIVKKVNLKQTKVKVILADLIDQKIITKTKRYEYIYGAPKLDLSSFEALRRAKLKDFDIIKNYIYTKGCRMLFINNYLGDNSKAICEKCDNDLLGSSLTSLAKRNESKNKGEVIKASDSGLELIQKYRESFFPVLDFGTRISILRKGVAASYYGVSNVGETLNRCKYHNGGDFPDYLIKLCLKAYRNCFKKEVFDVVLYVPPTESGDLVKNFAVKMASILKFPISHSLIKTRITEPQKVFETASLKEDNLKKAFTINEDIKGKKILIIDDIFDSGHTIKSIAKMLKKKGAREVAPITIAKQ